MPHAIIFDMDGLLVDSEPLWVRAEIAVFGEVGLTLSESDCAQTKGLRSDDVVAFWYARSPWKGATIPEVQATLCARVAALIRAEGRALAGVDHALAIAREGGRRVALASSSPQLVIDATLERLGLRDAFDVVQSADTERLGKPHPGIFLTTAERLGVAPTDCLVLEDSITGVIAAKAARMTCIAVPCDFSNPDPRFVLADATIGSLADLSADLVAQVQARTR
jgi:sugar-phosphatase